jgi:hypothetical protein
MALFTIGKMPLAAAWGMGWILSIGSTFMIVSVAQGSSFDQQAFFLWLLVPTGLTPMVAWIKGRRLMFWSATAIALFLVGIVQPYFQPLMALIALTLAGRPEIKIPEAELEADESARDMRELANIGRDVAAIQVAMAEEYVRRDVRRLRARVPEVQKIEARIAKVAPQKSERGHRARLHVAAATRILLRAGETATSIEDLVRANPYLQPFIDGGIVADRGKPAKRMAKSLVSLEEMVGRSANQLLVASSVLDALGYHADDLRPSEALATGDEDGLEDNSSQHPSADHSRPQRPRRRQRF